MTVYEEKDELFSIGVGRTQGQASIVVLGSRSHRHLGEPLPARRATPGGPFRVVLPREKGHKYDVEHRDGLFYIRTNKDAKNFRLVTAPVDDPSPANWKTFVAHRPDVLLEDLELFRDYLVLQEKSAGLNRLRVLDFATGAWTRGRVPGARLHRLRRAARRSSTRTLLRYSYQSLVTPLERLRLRHGRPASRRC